MYTVYTVRVRMNPTIFFTYLRNTVLRSHTVTHLIYRSLTIFNNASNDGYHRRRR